MIRKFIKWSASMMRLIVCKLVCGRKLKLSSGKPLYIGKGARVLLGEDSACELGEGVYLSRGCLLQVNVGARLQIADNVFLNENVRIVANESVFIGSNTLFGPNVCIYDHDHVFNEQGVSEELVSSPVVVGERCWVAANSLIVRGVSVADSVLIGGGSVVSRSLEESGVYVGAPAKRLKAQQMCELQEVSADDKRETS
jgi:acetyltransferase-like isoleucine patch superfamily enzyme